METLRDAKALGRWTAYCWRSRAPQCTLDVLRREDAAAFQALVQEEWKLVFCNHGLWRALASGAPEAGTCEALEAAWRESPRASLVLPT